MPIINGYNVDWELYHLITQSISYFELFDELKGTLNRSKMHHVLSAHIGAIARDLEEYDPDDYEDGNDE